MTFDLNKHLQIGLDYFLNVLFKPTCERFFSQSCLLIVIHKISNETQLSLSVTCQAQLLTF